MSWDHAVFRIGTWRSDYWAVCAFWFDDETEVGSSGQLDRLAAMYGQKYGISGERELRWTLGIKVNRDYRIHTISPSQGAYIDNIVERLGSKVRTRLPLRAWIPPKTSAPRRLRNFKTYLVTSIANSSVLCSTLRLQRDQISASPSEGLHTSSRTLVIPT